MIRKYYGLDGKECSLLDLIKRNPEWAEKRILQADKESAIEIVIEADYEER